ncbi:UNVERIFIED_CONTAM: Organelle RRM domain-containing protein 6, chloroplastic [Sesamum angustifolium]|uniref:Organelle RRM domain-containing protein 6, chloroplastic n=1 Tax=Sesamum angustifolium TaxID=2727405 RepID=A0AAW2Q9D2_9LAMI
MAIGKCILVLRLPLVFLAWFGLSLISGLSFRTTEDSLRNAFKNFGELVEVNLVMDKIANRPRGFAFLRYATEEESKKAIDGMHGKFLDGRVIFVEVAKSRAELRQGPRQNPS